MFNKYKLPVLISGRQVMAVVEKPRRPRFNGQDGPPRWLLERYRRFEPRYRYHNGILPARFHKVEQWREGQFAGKWVGFYTQRVNGFYGPSTERYVWVYVEDRFFQLKQFGLREVAQREFVG